MVKKNYIKSKVAETWTSEGVVFQLISPKINKINLEIAEELVNDRRYAMGKMIYLTPVIVFVNNATSLDKEANRYYKSNEPFKGISAIAMVMDNFAARLVASLVFKAKKSFVPTAFFPNEQKALLWLKKYQNLN